MNQKIKSSEGPKSRTCFCFRASLNKEEGAEKPKDFMLIRLSLLTAILVLSNPFREGAFADPLSGSARGKANLTPQRGRRAKESLRRRIERMTSLKWEHLSSKRGDLPAPGNSLQQTSALILDVDKDGRQDFIIGARQAGPCLVWYRNTPKGWKRYVIDPETLPIEAGGTFYDIDGDGDWDLVFGGDSSSNKVWWWENPYPHYAPDLPWKRYEIKDSGGTQHHDQIFGDFDGDGKAELVFWNQGVGKLLMAKIPSNPRQPWPLVEIYSGHGEGLAKGDLDGDGKEELFAGGRWLKHNGGTSFTAYWIDPSQSASRVAVGDLNGDGRLEVVMVPADGVGRLKWYECKGDPCRTSSWIGHDLLGQDVRHGHSLAVADFNQDGHLDIFCGEMRKWSAGDDNPEAKMWIFLGDGRGGFTKVEIARGFGVHEAKVGDLNGDGKPDILAKPYNWDTPRIDLWLNRG